MYQIQFNITDTTYSKSSAPYEVPCEVAIDTEDCLKIKVFSDKMSTNIY